MSPFAFSMILFLHILPLDIEIAKQCDVLIDRDKIGLAVLTMLEQGQLQKLHNTWWYGKGECVVDDSKVGYIKCVSHHSQVVCSNDDRREMLSAPRQCFLFC